MSEQSSYLKELTDAVADGWNRFWFTAMDPCVAGLLRLATGVLLVWSLSTYHVEDLVRLWGPHGFQSEEVVSATNRGMTRLSFWSQINDPAMFGPVHYTCIALAALFAVGLFSRATSVIATVILLSYAQRAPQMTTQLEPVLSILLVYLCIAPSGASFSIDAWLASGKKPGQPKPQPSFSAALGLRLIQVHIALLFLMSALGKLRGDVWWEGSAVWWLIARSETSGVDLTWLTGSLFWVIEVWTTFLLWYQSAFAIFIWNRLARPLLLALSIPTAILLGLATTQFELAAAYCIGSWAFIDPVWLRATTRRVFGEATAERLCPAVEEYAEEPIVGASRGSRTKTDTNARRELATANS